MQLDVKPITPTDCNIPNINYESGIGFRFQRPQGLGSSTLPIRTK